jgi:NAD(P)-dependent dehydrogenase (short-subunit alcohol dehydrogenase family)
MRNAREVARYVTNAGRNCVLVPGDLSDAQHCRDVVDRAVQELGGVDTLVNNSDFQMTHQSLDEISDEEWEYTFGSTSVRISTSPRRPCRT